MSEHLWHLSGTLCKRRPSPSSLRWPSQRPCHRSWPRRSWPHSPCALSSRCPLTCRRTWLRPPRWPRRSRRPSRCHRCLCSHSLKSPRRYRTSPAPPSCCPWAGGAARDWSLAAHVGAGAIAQARASDGHGVALPHGAPSCDGTCGFLGKARVSPRLPTTQAPACRLSPQPSSSSVGPWFPFPSS